MHERHLDKHQYGSSYKDCVQLCQKHAKDTMTNVQERMLDLRKMSPTKLWVAAKWPRQRAQREKKTREYLLGCSGIFEHKLPGFDALAQSDAPLAGLRRAAFVNRRM
ncbi:hypothetical protein CLOP_g23541 [Closterium sp. NIES-67]|nr:hypothetical protein CLOP_g23541 [Closterium sp. NIES-67]